MSSQQPYDYYNPPPSPSQQMYPPPNPYVPVAPPEPGRALAIAGLIVGIISLFTWLPFLGFPISIVGIILSAIGQRSVSRKGMAVAGLVLSIVTLILTLITTIAFLASSSSSSY